MAAGIQYYGTGRRKTATARVFLRPGNGGMIINRKPLEQAFPTEALRTQIKQPLAEELLFGKLVNGGEVKVRIKDNAPAFEIVPAAPKPSKTKPKPAKKKASGDAPAAE